MTPTSNRVRRASDDFNRLISEDLRRSKALAAEIFDKGRVLAAKLVGSTPDRIAYIQNTAHGLSLVALGLDWREGDNLVLCAEEFPSNYLCWLQLEKKGVEIRRVSAVDGRLTTDVIRGAVDARTRLVAVSHVQFNTGFRVDVAALGALCRNGPLLVVDGTQSIGAIGLDVGVSGVDVLAASAHKWMMGPRGIGFASFSDRAMAQIAPAVVGWMSVNDPFAFNRTLDFLPDARRYEAGTPNGTGIFGLVERLRQLDELGLGWIEARILDLNALACETAQRNGARPLYRFERRSSSGIALLQKPGMSAEAMQARLEQNKVYASIRSGAVRIATHYFNTRDEVERLAAALA